MQCMCALINWCWLKLGLAFWRCALFVGPVDVVGVGVPSLDLWLFVTPPPLRPVQSVNDPGGMVGTVWLLLVLLIVWWTCSTHTGVVVGVCHCVPFGCWSGCAVLLALFVDFQWSVEISWRMRLLEEQDDAVVGPSGPLNAHFRL